VGEIERDGDGAGALGGKPFVAEVAIGAEGNAAEREILVKLAEARLELGAFDADAKIADADGEEFFVSERGQVEGAGGAGGTTGAAAAAADGDAIGDGAVLSSAAISILLS